MIPSGFSGPTACRRPAGLPRGRVRSRSGRPCAPSERPRPAVMAPARRGAVRPATTRSWGKCRPSSGTSIRARVRSRSPWILRAWSHQASWTGVNLPAERACSRAVVPGWSLGVWCSCCTMCSPFPAKGWASFLGRSTDAAKGAHRCSPAVPAARCGPVLGRRPAAATRGARGVPGRAREGRFEPVPEVPHPEAPVHPAHSDARRLHDLPPPLRPAREDIADTVAAPRTPFPKES